MAEQNVAPAARAVYLVQESGGFAPRGKYHLAKVQFGSALCGREARTPFGWTVTADRDKFEATGREHRICKDCQRSESQEARR